MRHYFFTLQCKINTIEGNITMINKDDIVYFVNRTKPFLPRVSFGIIDAICEGWYYVDFLCIKECRYVDGVPFNDFKSTGWRKIPKEYRDCSYKIKPDITYRLTEDERSILQTLRIDRTDDIKSAYSMGLLVRSKEISHYQVTVELNRNNEYRFALELKSEYVRGTGKRIGYDKFKEEEVFLTYNDADTEKTRIISELKAEICMSDFEWNLRESRKVLKLLHDDALAKKYEDKLLSMKDFDDIEIKKIGDRIMWRYFSSKGEYKELEI